MIKVYCDSSTRKSCFVLSNGDKEDVHIEQYETQVTNNIGEYLAVIRALKHIRVVGITDFCIFTDSKLVVQQIKGFNKCKVAHLAILRETARSLLGADHIAHKNLRIEWIPREDNPAGWILEKI